MQGIFLKNAVEYSHMASDLLNLLSKSKSELKSKLDTLNSIKKLQLDANKLGFLGSFMLVLPIVSGVMPGVKIKFDNDKTAEEKQEFSKAAACLNSDEQACLIIADYLVPSLKDYESVLKGLTKIFEMIRDDTYMMSSKAQKAQKRSADDLEKAKRFLNAIMPICKEAAQACGLCLQLIAVNGFELAEIEKIVNEKEESWIKEWKVKHAENEKMIVKELMEVTKTMNRDFLLASKKKSTEFK